MLEARLVRLLFWVAYNVHIAFFDALKSPGRAMSWVVNLFNPGQRHDLTPTGDEQPIVFPGREGFSNNRKDISSNEWAQQQKQPMDEEEAAARSPYWHVSFKFGTF